MAPLTVRLEPEQLGELADAVASRLAGQLREQGEQPDHYMTTREAARYLGLSVSSVHKLTAAQTIPFEQQGPHCKCYFKRSALDAWRRSNGS